LQPVHASQFGRDSVKIGFEFSALPISLERFFKLAKPPTLRELS
jgi:hypothetical protein